MNTNAILPISEINTLWVTLSNRCNHRCTFCYQKDFTLDLPGKVFKEIEPIYKTIDFCVLQGGEVTILSGSMNFILSILRENSRVKFDIVTNGHFFNAPWRDLFLVHGRAVHFSINAATKQTYEKITTGGDWIQLIWNIENMIRMKQHSEFPIVRASMVVADDNIHEVYDFAKMCEHLGVDVCNITFDCTHFPTDRKLAAEMAERLKEIKIVDRAWINSMLSFANGIRTEGERAGKQFLCENAFRYLFIDVSGDVRYCCMMDSQIGNLVESTLEEVWNSEKAQNIRRLFLENKYQEAGCMPDRCMAFNN